MLCWQDVQSEDLIIVAVDDDDDSPGALEEVSEGSATSALTPPAPPWNRRDPPGRLWTAANVATLYRAELQQIARRVTAWRHRRTPHAWIGDD